MNPITKKHFTELWKKYFGNAELPITFCYTDKAEQSLTKVRCIISAMEKVRQGETLLFAEESIGCFGAKAYLGFNNDHKPTAEGEDYSFTEMFLSNGIPDKVPGERIKKDPETCRKMYGTVPEFKAPAPYLLFKRWDKLSETDNPDVAVFYGNPDIICGLYNLFNYDYTTTHGVTAPWGSGCSSIISDPYRQKFADKPQAVLGMLDIAARPFCSSNEMTIAVPVNRLLQCAEYMDNSFLATENWEKIRQRTK